MTPKNILAASILLLLGLTPQVKAANVPAQPITLSTAVGTDQNDFFITENGGGSTYVVFTGNIPLKGGKNDERLMYTSRIKYLGTEFITVGKYSPLRRIGLFIVPSGTVFDNFVANDITINGTYARELFHIPNKGLYLTTNGGAPAILRAENATYPLSNAVFRYPGEQFNNSTHDQQLRVLFGGYYLRKGFEPLTSAGSARATTLLSDLTVGVQPATKAGIPGEFTTYGDAEVYFVALNPASVAAASAQPYDIYRSGPKVPGSALLQAVPVTNGLAETPFQLTGMTTGLFYTSYAAGAADSSFHVSSDGASFSQVFNGGSAVVNANQLTPQISPSSGQVQHSLGLSAYDSNTSSYRFGIYDTSLGGNFYFPEFSNQPAGTSSYPAHIIPTGTHYFYTAYVGGAGPYLLRCFDGDSTGVQFVDSDVAGQHITNIGEIVDVTDGQSSGTLYFTGDAVVNGNAETGVLFSITPNTAGDINGLPIAVAARTIQGNLVHGAHHLGSVHDSQIFRLYFSAPVSAVAGAEMNVEYAPKDTHGVVIPKDYASKPWVLNVE